MGHDFVKREPEGITVTRDKIAEMGITLSTP